MEVFDRGSAFDPRTDSIVRVDARRLRLKLEEYYRHDGRGDGVQIVFAPGSYVPRFSFRQGPLSGRTGLTTEPNGVVLAPPPRARSIGAESVYALDYVAAVRLPSRRSKV